MPMCNKKATCLVIAYPVVAKRSFAKLSSVVFKSCAIISRCQVVAVTRLCLTVSCLLLVMTFLADLSCVLS